MKPQDTFPACERDFALSDADAKKVATVEKAWHQGVASITKKKQKSTNCRLSAPDYAALAICRGLPVKLAVERC